jgi:hypothetical protein
MKKPDLDLGWILLIMFLVVGSLFELTILGIAFFGADKVECNYFWCTFSTTRSEGYSSFVSNRDCFINGERVNCLSTDNIECVDKWKPHFCESLYDDVKKRLADGKETMNECLCFYSPKDAMVVHK